MSAGYTPQWISLLEAIEHVRMVIGGTIEEAWNALRIPLREGAVLSRFRGQEVGGIAAAIEGRSGAVPSSWWYDATVFTEGGVVFGAERQFGRRSARHEIEIQRIDLLRFWPEPSEATREPAPASAAPAFQRSRRGPAPGTLDRYGAADRALFDEIERIMRDDKVSITEATNRLATDGKIAGTGVPASGAKRLAARYRRERRN
jgi:hypothetical protein